MVDISGLLNFTDDVSNFKLYESEWVPKVVKYNEELKKKIPAEYQIDSSLVPGDLDDSTFSPIKFLYDNKILSKREFEITDTPAHLLVEKIASMELSSVEVLKAFVHRAVICQQFTNFVMDFFFEEGLKKAAELDKILKETGKTVGPLHGLPISLKEQVGYGGKITTGGWVSNIENVLEKDAVTIQVLRKLGAVFYVRTSQPQTIMHLDTDNNIIGRTRNSYNTLLSPGGSSGGEGACVSFGGSAMGVGTDIGGSIRAPAAFCGCFGLRPTSRRISTAGGVSAAGGQESVVAVCGPLTRYIDDVELFMESYINSGNPWDIDPWSLRIPWRKISAPIPQNLTIAVMYDDGVVKPLPPIERGLKIVVEKLKNAGVNIIEFKPIKTQEAYETVNILYNCDGNEKQKSLLKPSGEPLLPLTKWCLSFGKGDKPLSITENRNLNMIRDYLRGLYLDYMVNNKVDFILSPNYPSVAPSHKEGPHYWGYTSLWNILDMPSLTFPTYLYQDPSIDIVKDASYKPRSTIDEIEQIKYDAKSAAGAPIALQLTGRRYFDEEVVAAGKMIDALLKA
ncbi:hypothetical protein PACTADRAFT_48397 [Pachysolen tannophilus NRRL Y-2460]|uniref:amidase n=1 Tax=Pachysolen tannophilus NRRL Y-2460 TaxID=669874 RepID=A0A1E4TXW0_PACTA|nr:hypothetical protein PACTADRAFT_48397 [Pachysolen tannophilus NRRL Y-2460]